MPKVPMQPMLRILMQYAYSNKLPLDIRRFESVIRVFSHYERSAAVLN